VFKFVIHLPN